MTNLKSLGLDEPLYRYLLSHQPAETELLMALREETALWPERVMQITPEQGRFMAWLARLTGARRLLEIGVFTGYSALVTLLAAPADARMVACDLSDEWTSVARRYWQRAGVRERIDLRLGPALETLDALLAEGLAGQFDFSFIDADKTQYRAYYERVLELTRPGGLIILDNLLWAGKVADPGEQDADTEALRSMNGLLAEDPRIFYSLLPVADGLGLAIRL